MVQSRPWPWPLVAVVSCLKVLLIPSYQSTDFEVHRHWLALTRSLPVSLWYYDETSPWTLDYPPFFAFFERFLSLFAPLFDPKIAHLTHGLNYDAPSAVYFQRATVIASDLCLFYSLHRLGRGFRPMASNLMWVFVALSPMLLIVDHIHFQYNGFLLGLLLLSVSFLMEGRDLAGGFFFAVLLCFKHLFAVAAPLYFVYLLRHYCWGRGIVRGFTRLVIMGSVVLAVFAAAFGPFAYLGQNCFLSNWELNIEQLTMGLKKKLIIPQVLSQMFPFGRGLCHAYWAPNFWVFYIILDKVIAFILRKLGFSIELPTASFTGGLVGDSSPFAVLPRVTPLTTLVMVLLALLPCLIKAWNKPSSKLISRWVAYAYTCGFLFGWHVHEKASLHFVIPFTILAVQSLEDAKHYYLLSIVSCYSLFPLLHEAREYPIKVLLLLLHSLLMWLGFSAMFCERETDKEGVTARKEEALREAKMHPKSTMKREFRIGSIARIYLLGLVPVELYGQFLHSYLFGSRLPFVPLMMISTYCAIGIMYSWIWQLKHIIGSSHNIS